MGGRIPPCLPCALESQTSGDHLWRGWRRMLIGAPGASGGPVIGQHCRMYAAERLYGRPLHALDCRECCYSHAEGAYYVNYERTLYIRLVCSRTEHVHPVSRVCEFFERYPGAGG